MHRCKLREPFRHRPQALRPVPIVVGEKNVFHVLKLLALSYYG
jgi:hypothetical protein